MAVGVNGKKRIFTIRTKQTTYQMMADAHGVLLHLYYGPRAEGEMDYLLNYYDRGFSGNPGDTGNERSYSLDALPQEYPQTGTGDYRSPSGIRGIRSARECRLFRDCRLSMPTARRPRR